MALPYTFPYLAKEYYSHGNLIFFPNEMPQQITFLQAAKVSKGLRHGEN